MDGGETTPPARPVTVHTMDLVKFQPAAGAHGDRGVAFPTAGELSAPVVCADGALVTRELRDLTVLDRGSSMYRGQTVTSASYPGGQVGVVTGVHTELDLVIPSGEDGGGEPAPVARAVSPGAPQRVRELCYGDCVVSGPWLGGVVGVYVDVDVLFDDGAVCRVKVDGDSALVNKAFHRVYMESRNFPYYPGQRVVAADHQPSTFEPCPCQWLTGRWNPSRVEGTVCKVHIAAVLVYWLAAAHLGADRALVRASAPPPLHRNPRLAFFRIAAWGVGDDCFFWNPHPHGRDDDQARAEFERSMCVADVRTTVDVLWQDGTRLRGVPSASLEPFEALNDHDFFPGERVVVADAGEAGNFVDGGEVRLGVVRSHNCCDHTVRVSWFKPSSSSSPPTASSCELECDETVSAYDLRTDGDIFYGCLVVRLPSPPLLPPPLPLPMIIHGLPAPAQDG